MQQSSAGLSLSLHTEPAVNFQTALLVSRYLRKVCCPLAALPQLPCAGSLVPVWLPYFLSFSTVQNTSSKREKKREERSSEITSLTTRWLDSSIPDTARWDEEEEEGQLSVYMMGGLTRLNIDLNHHYCSNCPRLLPTPKNAKCRMTLCSASLSQQQLPLYSQLLVDTNGFWSACESAVTSSGVAERMCFSLTGSECSKPEDGGKTKCESVL